MGTLSRSFELHRHDPAPRCFLDLPALGSYVSAFAHTILAPAAPATRCPAVDMEIIHRARGSTTVAPFGALGNRRSYLPGHPQVSGRIGPSAQRATWLNKVAALEVRWLMVDWAKVSRSCLLVNRRAAAA